jgi:hypothetical protein
MNKLESDIEMAGDNESTDWEMNRQEKSELYLNGLLKTRVEPFFAEMLPSFYAEDVSLSAVSDGSADWPQHKGRDSGDILYPSVTGDGNELASFESVLGKESQPEWGVRRELIDTLILTHEAAHIFETQLLKRMGRQDDERERVAAAREVFPDVDDQNIRTIIEKVMKKIYQTHKVGITEDYGEAFARSMERLMVETMYEKGEMSDEEYQKIDEYMRTRRTADGDIIDPENKLYEDEFLYRMYRHNGEAALADFVGNFDQFGSYRVVRKGADGQITDEYKSLLADSDQMIATMGKINANGIRENFKTFLKTMGSEIED